jgi:Ca2+/Na+ antiporter
VFLVLVLYDGKIQQWESLFLIGWYILYVVVVVAGRRINKRLKQYYKEREARRAAAAAATAATVNAESGADTHTCIGPLPHWHSRRHTHASVWVWEYVCVSVWVGGCGRAGVGGCPQRPC